MLTALVSKQSCVYQITTQLRMHVSFRPGCLPNSHHLEHRCLNFQSADPCITCTTQTFTCIESHVLSAFAIIAEIMSVERRGGGGGGIQKTPNETSVRISLPSGSSVRIRGCKMMMIYYEVTQGS